MAAGAAAAFDGAAPSDFFELLGIEPSSDVAAVKDAYRRLQRLCHPDICGKNAERQGCSDTDMTGVGSGNMLFVLTTTFQ